LGASDGIEVVGRGVTSGQGVALAGLLMPDVILLDESVDQRGGASAVHSMRNASPKTKVVVLADDPHSTAPAGSDGLLGKDTDLAEVVAAVRSVHESGRVPITEMDILDPAWWSARTTPELSERELEVLGLLCRGMANKEIAQSLSLSQHTIHNHVARIFNKLGAHSRLEAVSIAAREGLISLN
jgi:DNA-binding NarL/FixJ family response regulator